MARFKAEWEISVLSYPTLQAEHVSNHPLPEGMWIDAQGIT